ncbi:MAG: NAD(P)/FAD-dependent oxidoreductase [Selenomonadales bacterium]|jgi:NAD(P)H-nitrite reductase large subunit|nr:NAD(P)/FAD-dependent oxidoreductase [Selenomonadales bacterium]MBQ2246201.1 NAD(P)/FAD-dependent oxidoreductase [Selenomonadales bacterium]MBQ5636616.1 NAD(P)/FAD-dependent oxidoreductase [Selenomonadales bacterium]
MTAKKDRLDKGAIVQRDMNTYAVAPHIPGGIILDSNVLRKLADVADKYGAQALKITTAQRIAIVGLKEEDLDDVWKDLDMSPGHALGSCVRSVRICPATTFCKRAKQDAVSLGLEIDKLYHGMPLPSKFKIAVSGCQNSCSEPACKDLGIMGTPKGYTVMIGGNAGVLPRLADKIAADLTHDEVLALVAKIVEYYKATAKPHERLGRMIDRIGLDEVKKAILGE